MNWYEVQMHAYDAMRVVQTENRTHPCSKVPSLDSEARVSQLAHQFRPQCGHAKRVHSANRGPIGKTESGQRGNHHVKRIGGIATMSNRVGQQREDAQHLNERSGPPMRDHQRYGRGSPAAFVNEVDPDAIGLVAIMMKFR